MNKLIPLKNYLYSYGGSLDVRQWARLIRYLPDTTVSKKFIKFLFRLFFYLSLQRILVVLKRRISPLNDLEYFKRYDGFITFSSNLRERYRFYSFASYNDRVLFVKVIKGGCLETLKNEKLLVSHFLELVEGIHVLSHIGAEIIDDYLILEYDVLPEGARRIDGDGLYERYFRNIRNDISTKTYRIEVLKGLNWYNNYMKYYAETDYSRYMLDLLKGPIELGLAHGDLGSENIFYCEDKIWIIDWEKANAMAPVMTDYMGLNMNKYLSLIDDIPLINRDALRLLFEEVYNEDFTYLDFLLGIAFYGGTSFKPMVDIIQNFRSDEK